MQHREHVREIARNIKITK